MTIDLNVVGLTFLVALVEYWTNNKMSSFSDAEIVELKIK